MPTRFKAILASLLAIFAAEPRIHAADAMRVGFESFADPLSFEQPDGTLAGFAVELVHAVAREMEFTVRPVVGPWDEILRRFRAGEIDVLASLAYTPERDVFVEYATTHLVMIGEIFVRRGDRWLRQPADIAHRRIAVQRDSFSHEYLRRRGWDRQPVFVRDLREAMVALEENRCDAVAAARIVGNHVIRKFDLKRVVGSEVTLPDFTLRLHMGVVAGDAARLAVLNEGLARIRTTAATIASTKNGSARSMGAACASPI